MNWYRSHRFDPAVVPLADRHYNRQKIGSPQFAPAGSCCVFKVQRAFNVVAFWITSAPKYARHAWPNAWVCTAFRNESELVSSDLIREAVAATVAHYGPPPSEGMITFVDPRKTPGVKVRGKLIHGFCFWKAGFKHVGFTEVNTLWVWHLAPSDFPMAEPCRVFDLFDIGEAA